MIFTCLHFAVIASVVLSPSQEIQSTPTVAEIEDNRPIPGYCGLYCFHSCLKLLGKKVEFASLVKNSYLSSRSGSSVEDLVLAAKEHGLHSAVRKNMSCGMLPLINVPLLLHVRSDPKSATYNHWMLLLGTDHDHVTVYDGEGKTIRLPISRLAGLWDGVGIFLSNRPIDTTYIYAYFALVFLAIILSIGISFISLASLSTPKLVAQSFHVVMLTFGFVGILILFTPGRYITDHEIIRGVQERHISDIVVHITAADVANCKDALIVDARHTEDYSRGHVPGVVSFPANYLATPERLLELFGEHDRTKCVIIYCQSAGCNFDEYIGNLFCNAGFTDVRFFVGGWREWKEQSLP